MLGGAQKQDDGALLARTALRHFRTAYPAFRRDVESVWSDDDCRRYVELLIVCAREGGLRGLPTVRATLYQLREIARLEPLLRPHLPELTRCATWSELRDAMRLAWRGFKLHAYVKIYGNRGRRYFRAWLAERHDGDPLLRKLPLVAPLWRRPPVLAAGAAGTLAFLGMGLWLWLGAGAGTPAPAPATTHSFGHASRVIPGDLGEGPRLVLGFNDGAWAIARHDGTVVYESPASLRVPGPIEGGAIGDVDGDGLPEIALIRGPSLDQLEDAGGRYIPPERSFPEIEAGRLRYRPAQSGVWLFTRRGGEWRLLDLVTAQVGAGDPARCREIFLDHWRAQIEIRRGRYTITDELEDRRRLCQSNVYTVELRPGSMLMFLGSYGRAILEARCDGGGCDDPELRLAIDADLTSFVRTRDSGGAPRLIVSTACWRENSRHAYSLLTLDPSRLGAPPEEAAWFGGWLSMTAIDERRLAVVSGTPCEGFREHEYLAGDASTRVGPRLRQVVIGHVDAGGLFVEEQAAPLANCCYQTPTPLRVLHDPTGEPVALATAYEDERRAPGPEDGPRQVAGYVAIFDLSGGTLGEPFRVTFPARSGVPELAAVDLDGDGAEELVVSVHVSNGSDPMDARDDENVTRVYRLVRRAGGLELAPWR